MDDDPNPLYLEFNFDSNFDLNFQQRLAATSSISHHHPDFYGNHEEFYQPYDTQQMPDHQPQYVYNHLEFVTASQQHHQQHYQHQTGPVVDGRPQQFALDGYTIEMAADEMQYVGNDISTEGGVPLMVQQMKREHVDGISGERIIISTPRMIKQPAVVRRQTEVQTHGQQTRCHGRKQPHIGILQMFDDDYPFQLDDHLIDVVEAGGGDEVDAEVDMAELAEAVEMDSEEKSIVATVTTRSAVELSWTPVRPSKRLLEKTWMPKSKKRLLTAINTPEEDD